MALLLPLPSDRVRTRSCAADASRPPHHRRAENWEQQQIYAPYLLYNQSSGELRNYYNARRWVKPRQQMIDTLTYDSLVMQQHRAVCIVTRPLQVTFIACHRTTLSSSHRRCRPTKSWHEQSGVAWLPDGAASLPGLDLVNNRSEWARWVPPS